MHDNDHIKNERRRIRISNDVDITGKILNIGGIGDLFNHYLQFKLVPEMYLRIETSISVNSIIIIIIVNEASIIK
jgi:hypothetical protein